MRRGRVKNRDERQGCGLRKYKAGRWALDLPYWVAAEFEYPMRQLPVEFYLGSITTNHTTVCPYTHKYAGNESSEDHYMQAPIFCAGKGTGDLRDIFRITTIILTYFCLSKVYFSLDITQI